MYFAIFLAFKMGKFINVNIVGVFVILMGAILVAKVAQLIALTSVSVLYGSCEASTTTDAREPICAGVAVYSNLVFLFIATAYFLGVLFLRRSVLQRVPEPGEKLKTS